VKVKAFLNWVEDGVLNGTPLDRQLLQSGKGFLLHVVQTFDFAQPYMKGFHLAENMWRPGGDRDGWKIQAPNLGTDDDFDNTSVSSEESDNCMAEWDDWEAPVAHPFENVHQEDTNKEPNARISKFPPRLYDDIKALQRFFAPEDPDPSFGPAGGRGLLHCIWGR
jgi:hypothetical protein